MPGLASFTPGDLAWLRDQGIGRDSADFQIRRLREGSTYVNMIRACSLGDGIETLPEEEWDALGEEFFKASSEGRLIHFIPASGAATRMVEALNLLRLPGRMASELKARADAGDSHAREAWRIWDEWEKLPFHERVNQRLKEKGESVESLRKSGAVGRLFSELLHAGGEGLAELPKALVPFHKQNGIAITPLEEHIREAAALAGPKIEPRLHFTVSPEHEMRYKAQLETILKNLRAEHIRAEVTHSFQDPASRTLALGEDGQYFRDAGGALLLRPSGHGALLKNLESCGADFAWLRNIDNIASVSHRVEGRKLRRALAGKLIRIAGERRVSKSKIPLRVCAMVRNTGEPGGSPFFIAGPKGEEIRIVEPAQVNPLDARQQKIFRSATHFNPVDMICSLRDSGGKPYDLERFADPESCLVSRKNHEGHPVSVLERPGLWNGGMAHWETQCIEIPLSQFAPVKVVVDLLRPEHQS